MSPRLSPTLAGTVRQYVADHLGLHFEATRVDDLERGLERAAADFGCDGIESLVRKLVNDKRPTGATVERLAAHLTVGETYFFRDERLFHALQYVVLPTLAARRRDWGRRLRVWSAGCSSGEEAWSLAIALKRVLPAHENWAVSILGTDINTAALERARRGLYGRWSFRRGRQAEPGRFVREVGPGSFQVVSELREMVRFGFLNLAIDSYPSPGNGTAALDLILCRNVLIYFNADLALEVVRRLRRCLAPDGQLILGPSELHLGTQAGMESRVIDGFHLFFDPASQDDGMVGRETTGPEWWTGEATSENWLRTGDVLPLSRPSPEAPEAPDVASPSTACEPHAEGADLEPRGQLLARIREAADGGQLELAARLAGEAVRRDRTDHLAYHLQAVVLQELGDLDGAAESWRRTLFLAPEHIMGNFFLGSLELRSGRQDSARRHLLRARQLLGRLGPGEEPPDQEGMRADRLLAMVDQMLSGGGR